MQDVDNIVIGTGMGGLTTALLLVRAGQSVMMFEQHYVPGGWAHSFLRDGYKFSPGVHFVGGLHEGGTGREVYEGIGVANDMEFFRQNPKGYDYNIVGDDHFRMPAGVDNLRNALSEKYPKSAKNIKRYLDFNQTVYDELFIAIADKTSIKDYLLLPWRTRHIGRTGLMKFDTIAKFFLKDPVVRTHLSLQCGNYGLPPFLAPWPVHCIVSNHCIHGTSYPRGSGSGIVKAFTKNIKKLGGEIRTSTGVKRILLDEKSETKKAVGVELQNGEKYFAKRVISNADPNITYNKLLGPEHVSKKLIKKVNKTKYSAAALNLFMVVDMDLRKAGMDSGNVWYSEIPDLNKVYEAFTRKDILQDDVFPAMFITSPTLKDPVSYDGKYHTLELIVFCHYHTFEKFKDTAFGERNDEYDDFKRKIEQKMLRTLEKVLPGVSRCVKMIELGTPNTSEHYVKATEGNCYGPDKILSQVGPFTYKRKTEIEDLYMTGAATFAHGLIGAVESGVNTVATILGCEKKDLLVYNEGQELKLYEAEDDSQWPEHLKKKAEVKRRRGADKELETVEI